MVILIAGKWHGWVIAKERQIDLSDPFEKGLFENAVAFSNSVKAGEVDVKEVAPETPTDLPPIKEAPKSQDKSDDGDPF